MLPSAYDNKKQGRGKTLIFRGISPFVRRQFMVLIQSCHCRLPGLGLGHGEQLLIEDCEAAGSLAEKGYTLDDVWEALYPPPVHQLVKDRYRPGGVGGQA
jgi:hypothetical protein